MSNNAEKEDISTEPYVSTTEYYYQLNMIHAGKYEPNKGLQVAKGKERKIPLI